MSRFAEARQRRPQEEDSLLYEEVLMDYLACTREVAEEIVDGSKNSYAIWPVERPVRLNDIAHYVVVKELLSASGDSTLQYSEIRSSVDKVVPKHM